MSWSRVCRSMNARNGLDARSSSSRPAPSVPSIHGVSAVAIHLAQRRRHDEAGEQQRERRRRGASGGALCVPSACLRKCRTMRIRVKPVIMSSSVGSSVSSPIITTTPTVPLRCRPFSLPLPSLRSSCGAARLSSASVVATALAAAGAAGRRLWPADRRGRSDAGGRGAWRWPAASSGRRALPCGTTSGPALGVIVVAHRRAAARVAAAVRVRRCGAAAAPKRPADVSPPINSSPIGTPAERMPSRSSVRKSRGAAHHRRHDVFVAQVFRLEHEQSDGRRRRRPRPRRSACRCGRPRCPDAARAE